MRERNAIILATLVAPIVPAAALTMLSFFNPMADKSSYTMPLVGFFFAYLVSANIGLILGLPAFLGLRYLRLLSWWSAIVVGAGIGVLVAAVFPRGVFSASTEFVVDSLIGAGAALVFWSIWRRSRTE